MNADPAEPARSPNRRAAGVRRTRASALAAVRELMVADGYHQLGLEQVAERAGITRITLYRHFGSKLGLLSALADELAERGQLVERVEAALALERPVASLRALVEELCRFWALDPSLLRQLTGLAVIDPEIRSVTLRRELWRLDQVRRVVSALDDHGLLRAPYDAVDRASSTIATLTSFGTADQLAETAPDGFAGVPDLVLPLLGPVVRLEG